MADINSNVNIKVEVTGADEAKKKIADLKGSGDTAAKGLETLGSKAKTAGGDLAELGSKAGGTGGFVDGLKEKFSGLTSKLGDLTGGAGGAGGGLANLGALAGGVAVAGVVALGAAIAAGVAGLVALTSQALDSAAALADLASKTNIAVERLSYLQVVASLAGGSFDMWTNASEKLSSQLAKQDEETGKVTKAIKDLDVSMVDADGNKKSSLQLMQDIIVAAAESKDKAQGEALAVTALGKEYYALRGSVLAAKEEGEEYYEMLSTTGGIVTKETAEASNKFKDTIAKVGTVMGGVGNSILTVALPILQAAIDKIYSVGVAFAETMARITGNQSAFEKNKSDIKETMAKIAELEENAIKLAPKGKGNWFQNDLLAGNQKSLDAARAKMLQLRKVQMELADEAKKTKDEIMKGVPGEGTTTESGKPPKPTKPPKVPKSEAEKEAEKEEKRQYDLALKTAQERQKLRNKEDEDIAKYFAKTEEDRGKAIAKEAEDQKKRFDKLVEITDEGYSELIKIGQEAENKMTFKIRTTGMSESQKEQTELMDQLGARREKDIALIRAQNVSMEDQEKQIARLNEAYETSKTKLEETAKLRENYNASWANGFVNAMTTYQDAASNIASQSEAAFTNAFKGMEDALVNFAMTGKLSFKDLASSIIADIIRMQAKAAVSGLLGMLFGGGGGILDSIIGRSTGAIPSAVPVGGVRKGMATGGPVSAHNEYVVGEAGPEIIRMGNKNGYVTANNKIGTGGMVNNINITVQGGSTNEDTGYAVSEAVMRTMEKVADRRIQNSRRVGGINNAIGAM